MPEVPEVQAHAERLDASFAGAELARFDPLAFTALKTVQPDPAVTHGEELTTVSRRGKALLLGFPSATHVVHLMQGGRLKPDEKQARAPRNGQARWTFADGRALLLTEAGTERKAGVWGQHHVQVPQMNQILRPLWRPLDGNGRKIPCFR